MKRKEIVSMWNALQSCGKMEVALVSPDKVVEVDRKFMYAVARNIGLIEPIIKAINEFTTLKTPEDLEKKRQELLVKYSDKDDKNFPIMVNGGYKFSSENRELLEKEINVLIKESGFDKVQEEHIKKSNEFLDEEEEELFQPYLIKEELLPPLKLNFMFALLPMVQEELKVIKC